MAQTSLKFELPVPPPDKDKRRRRSQSSRRKIIKALLALVGEGDYAPSAARVAEVAGVGSRTVFRHFDDMDSLYGEMTEALETWVLPYLLAPLEGATWRELLRSAVDQRAQVFEMVMPYRISANLKRFQSDYLLKDYRRMLALEKSLVEALLPDAVKADAVTVHAINTALSFQTWRVLRHDHLLPVGEAKQVVCRLLDAVIAQIPEPCAAS